MLQAATDENRADGMEKEFFAQFKGKFLTGGDFHGHHQSWGNSKNCTTGNNCTIVSPKYIQTLRCQMTAPKRISLMPQDPRQL
jgi:hypothetical protein